MILRTLGDHIRMIQILKTRFGEADKEIAVNFHGGINMWAELRKLYISNIIKFLDSINFKTIYIRLGIV